MLKRVFVGLVILLVASIAILRTFVVSKELTFERLELDLGEVSANAVVRMNFPYFNYSSRDITISSITGSCGCISSEATGLRVKSNSGGSLNAVLSTAGLRSNQPFRKHILVRFVDGASPVELTIKGFSRPLVALSERFVSLSCQPSETTLVSIERLRATDRQFSTCRLISLTDSISITKTYQGRERIDFEVSLVRPIASRYLPFLDVEIMLNEEPLQIARVGRIQCERRGVVIEPSAYRYVFSFPSTEVTTKLDQLRNDSMQCFKLSSGFLDEEIVAVSTSPQSSEA